MGNEGFVVYGQTQKINSKVKVVKFVCSDQDCNGHFDMVDTKIVSDVVCPKCGAILVRESV